MQNKRKPPAPTGIGMAEGPLNNTHLYNPDTKKRQARIEREYRVSQSFAKFYAEELDTSASR